MKTSSSEGSERCHSKSLRFRYGAIAASVHNLGKGLVTIGGSTAYGPGGWQGTPLEDALPGSKVDIDLATHKVSFTGDKIRGEEAIREAGYTPEAR